MAMMTDGAPRLAINVARDVSKEARLSDEARKLLKDNLGSMDYLNALITKNLFQDAVRFWAHALQKREAVLWACRCARTLTDRVSMEPVKSALEAAERWVTEPSEDNRRAALPAAEKAELSTPAGCAAMGAFW